MIQVQPIPAAYLANPAHAQFLDTNVFLRHLLNDDPVRSPKCLALFKKIEAETRNGWTSDLVVAELVFILSSKRTYNLPRPTIRDLLLPLLNLRYLHMALPKRRYAELFELYTTLSIDYIDCYHAVLVRNRKYVPELLSFDGDFDKVEGVSRFEP